MSARSEAEAASRRKATVTGAAAAASVAAGVLIAWPLVVVGAVPTAILGWGWWKHRVEHGLRL